MTLGLRFQRPGEGDDDFTACRVGSGPGRVSWPRRRTPARRPLPRNRPAGGRRHPRQDPAIRSAKVTLASKTILSSKGSANWDSAFDTLVETFKKVYDAMEKRG